MKTPRSLVLTTTLGPASVEGSIAKALSWPLLPPPPQMKSGKWSSSLVHSELSMAASMTARERLSSHQEGCSCCCSFILPSAHLNRGRSERFLPDQLSTTSAMIFLSMRAPFDWLVSNGERSSWLMLKLKEEISCFAKNSLAASTTQGSDRAFALKQAETHLHHMHMQATTYFKATKWTPRSVVFLSVLSAVVAGVRQTMWPIGLYV